MILNKSNIRLSELGLKAILASFSVAGLFYAQAAFADMPVIPTLDQVIKNITDNVPQLMQAVTALAYVLGAYFVITGVIEMKHFGESRSMMSQEHGLKKPLIHFFVGAALIYLPSSIQAGLDTLWGGANPLSYIEDKASPWSILISNSFLILQFIGVVAFIRGLLVLTTLAGHGGQPGTFMRGMVHIIGGILCINMYDTVNMIAVTLGLDPITSYMFGT